MYEYNEADFYEPTEAERLEIEELEPDLELATGFTYGQAATNLSVYYIKNGNTVVYSWGEPMGSDPYGHVGRLSGTEILERYLAAIADGEK